METGLRQRRLAALQENDLAKSYGQLQAQIQKLQAEAEALKAKEVKEVIARIRTAIDDAGKLLALEIDFNLDGGAYVTLSPVVLSRGAIHAAGPYVCPHVRVTARAWAMLRNMVSLSSSSRIRPLKLSTKPFFMGFPGAM